MAARCVADERARCRRRQTLPMAACACGSEPALDMALGRSDTLLNAICGEIPRDTQFIHAKATAVSTSPGRQAITLSNAQKISARQIILATGLSNGLRRRLGIAREEPSPCHSISLGFDAEPVGRQDFESGD